MKHALEASALLFLASMPVACGGGRAVPAQIGHLAITGNIPSATVNTAYAATLVAQGGTPPYSFGIVRGSLPTGLSLAADTGAITGTPTVAGMFNVTFSATDRSQSSTGQQPITMQVLPASISVSVNPLSSTLASSGTQQFTATVTNSTDTTVTWSATIGSIASSGLYTAPSVIAATALVVQAVSNADPAKSASANVLVQAQGLLLGADNRYCLPGDLPNFGTTFDEAAQLPASCVNTSLASTPSNGGMAFVANGGDIQTAVDNAACGDTVELEAGGTFAPITLQGKACDAGHWITIRTSAPDSALPPEGTRISPCYAGVASLPGRPALNCVTTNNVMAMLVLSATSGSGPINFQTGANHYRFIGLEITRNANGGFIGNLAFPDEGATGDHIIFDRVWMHGTPQDDTARGVSLSGLNYVAVVDSYFSDFHCESKTGSCIEAQTVSGGLGDTQNNAYKIVNNFLEASAQSIFFGGGAATTTPTDIEVRRNHLFKPLTWMPGNPGIVVGNHGYPFIVKNHFELKNAQRVLFEGNLSENVWGGFSQEGFTLLLTPKNQSTAKGYVCPLCQVLDVTVRYSKFSHSGSGFQFANVKADGGGGLALAGERYSVHDVILEDVDAVAYTGQGQLAQVSTAPAGPLLSDLRIAHVTAFPTKTLFDVGNPVTAPKMPNFAFSNSIVTTGAFPVWSTGGGAKNCAYGNLPSSVLDNCFTGYFFGYNALVAVPNNYPPSVWPNGNVFLPDAPSVGFVNFNNGNGGDYHLLPGSPAKGAASDGKDLGADVDAVDAATAGVN